MTRVYSPAVPDDHASAEAPKTATPTFDDAAIERLRLAAEEVAWLTGRGYALDAVGEIVAKHHGLSETHRAALARGTCSEPQYRRRAARELEAEDVARRPLSIDAIDAVATIEAALSGQPVLQTLDGTVRAFGIERTTWVSSGAADDALDRIFATTKELRPSQMRFVLDEGASAAADLEARINARAKAHKAKAEVVRVPNALKALRKEKQIVTGDAETLDACAAWFNLIGRIVEAVAGAKVIRLQ
jgi:hypothetical protein